MVLCCLPDRLSDGQQNCGFQPSDIHMFTGSTIFMEAWSLIFVEAADKWSAAPGQSVYTLISNVVAAMLSSKRYASEIYQPLISAPAPMAV